MGDVSLALCIPTYERDKVVEDFLTNCSSHYIQAGIDIYYYDSSVSDKTKDIVCGWPDQEHVHYIRLPSDLHPNAKAYKIYQGYGLKKKYDFIWLSGDALQYKKEAIAQFISNLSLDYDIVEINCTDYEQIGTRVFTDPDEYMQMCAWHTGLFGALALNSHTMLNGVDWTFYEEKFLVPGLIDLSHVSFYFYRILELARFRAFHLSVPHSQFKASKFKKKAGWIKDLLYVMCEVWVQTIEGLPVFYTNKKSACLKWGDLSTLRAIDRVYQYRKHGMYSLKVYFKYKDVWSKVTSIPSAQLLAVACTPRFLIKLYEKTYSAIAIAKLKKFCKSHPKIMIYGTGNTGEMYDQLFKRECISYDSFCVSRRKPNKTEYLQHPVYEFEEVKGALKEIGLVIALVEGNAEEVLAMMDGIVDKSHVFYNPYFIENIRRENGHLF